ncbi:hypothetical protein LTR53_003302 [Teratosphaeriaceae sp. CCFEE 6253]|nr:hypothetical protein LTR53_003302 [Teratosphaeriaceae sp. CCFEE 6253]
MQRTQQCTSHSPLHLRRGNVQHYGQSLQPSYVFDGNGSNHVRETLELSLHLPPKHYTLPSPPPETETIEKPHVPARYRRSRNSRGTKEAKRRRDVRRSRRKMAAQMLDEQLSREIDFALSKMDSFPTPPSSVPSPTPVLPMTMYAPVWPTSLPPLPPSPPQMPVMDVRSFSANVNSFLEAHLARSKPSPSMPQTPVIPSWCPPLPCLARKWSGSPIFYDLSSIPEPEEAFRPQREPKLCKELQLWRSNINMKPKQSRFFPALPVPPRAKVKLALAPTACTLHVSEKTSSGTSPAGPITYAAAVKKGIEVDGNGDSKAADSTANIQSIVHIRGPSAANLWNILADPAPCHTNSACDPYLASFKLTSDDDDPYLAAWQGYIDTTEPAQGPFELDGREVPYVHANSLTGHSNEGHQLRYPEELPGMADSAVCFTPLASPPLGLNEMMVDYDIGPPLLNRPRADAQDLADGDRPMSMQHNFDLAEALPVDYIEDVDGGEESLATSDAHFNSECSLFSLGTPPPAQPRAESIISIATFLKMGHARNCWCQDCEADAPLPSPASVSERDVDMDGLSPLVNEKDIEMCELSPLISEKDIDTPELVPFDKLTELDDDWMLYSANGGESSSPDVRSITSTPPASSKMSEGVRAATPMPGRRASAWDDFFPCRPHVTCNSTPVCHVEDPVRFGGSNDFEWEWESEF